LEEPAASIFIAGALFFPFILPLGYTPSIGQYCLFCCYSDSFTQSLRCRPLFPCIYHFFHT
jgi:hypothetical protein